MIRKREDEWCRCERGYALVLALICLAVLAMLAAFYAARITTQSRCSAHLFVALQNELLAFSAEEEARMVLALGDGGIERGSGQLVSREAYFSDGTPAGTYSWRLHDESRKERVSPPAGTEYRSIAESSYCADYGTRTVFGEQRVLTWRKGRLSAPVAVNVPTPALLDALLGAAAQGACTPVDAWRAYACIADAVDTDHGVTVTGRAEGREALRPVRFFDSTPRRVTALATRDSERCIHIGRLMRGWMGWNSSLHFTPEPEYTQIEPERALIVFKDPFRATSLEGKHEALLETFDPGRVNRFGIEHMWQGTVFKVLIGDVCSQTNEEWLIVEDNRLEDGRMVFECRPLFGGRFSAMFQDSATWYQQYGAFGWIVRGDPLLPGAVDREAEYGYAVTGPCDIDPEHGSSTPEADTYVCDAFILRGLDPAHDYILELQTDVTGTDGGGLEVLAGDSYRKVAVQGGRALLCGGRPQQPDVSASGEGYIVLALRSRVERRSRRAYAVALTELARGLPPQAPMQPGTAWSEWVSTSDRAIDLREWELKLAHGSGVTQRLGRIEGYPGGAEPFLGSRSRMRLIHSEPAYALRRRAAVPELALDTRLELQNVRDNGVEAQSGDQELTLVLAKDRLGPGVLAGRIVRLWPPLGTEPSAWRSATPSACFEVISNTVDTIAIRLPRVSPDTQRYLDGCEYVECLGLPAADTGAIVLEDAWGHSAAILETSQFPREELYGRAMTRQWNDRTWRTGQDQSTVDSDAVAAHTPAVYDRPLRSRDELREVLRSGDGKQCGTELLWRILEDVHLNCTALDLGSAHISGALAPARGTAIMSDQGLTDAGQRWDDHVWQGHYVRVDGAGAKGDMFRIKDNCTHCLEVADTGFPSGSAMSEAGISNGAAISYQVVTPDGSPLVMAYEQGSGAVRFRLESPADLPFRLMCRSASPGPCRAVLAVCAGEDGPVYAVVSNDCAAGQWITPAIRPPVSITQVYVRITLRGVPKAPTYFHDFVYVPDERRVNAINVNTAKAGELQQRLGWPADLAETAVAQRPYASLAELREVPGMTDARLLDACGAILLRSDNWSVEIHSRTKDTPATRVTWMKRDAEATGDRGYAPVSVVERRSVSRGR